MYKYIYKQLYPMFLWELSNQFVRFNHQKLGSRQLMLISWNGHMFPWE